MKQHRKYKQNIIPLNEVHFHIDMKSNLVDGKWSEWESWGNCSVSCGRGYRIRIRKCDNPTPAYGGKDCKSNSHEGQECNSSVSCPGKNNSILTLEKYE